MMRKAIILGLVIISSICSCNDVFGCGDKAGCPGTAKNTDLTQYTGELAKNYTGVFKGDITDGNTDIKCAQDGEKFALSLGEIKIGKYCSGSEDEQNLDCHDAFSGGWSIKGELSVGDNIVRKVNGIIEVQSYKEFLDVMYDLSLDKDTSLYNETFDEVPEVSSLDNIIESFNWGKLHKGNPNATPGKWELCKLNINSHESP